MITFASKSRTSRLVRLGAIAVVSIALQGCFASSQTRIVTDDQRTSDTKYDGKWTLSFAKAARTQQLTGNWEMSCGGNAFTVDATVKNGVMRLTDKSFSGDININDAGGFRGEWALKPQGGVSSASDSTVTKNKRKMILQGRLNDKNAKGRFTVGIEQFGYQGCQQQVAINR